MDQRNGIDETRDSGRPGGGAGRREEVGGSGVYPASAPNIPPHAEVRTAAGWGRPNYRANGYQEARPSEPSRFPIERSRLVTAPTRRRGWPITLSNDRSQEYLT